MNLKYTMNECIFCKIANNEIPSYKVWEDKNFCAFLDINPINKGHILLIPKKHHDYLFDYNNKDYIKLLLKAKMISSQLKKIFSCKKIGLYVEGISISHLHLHLVPINDINDLDPCKARSIKKENLEELQKEIKSFLDKNL